DVVKACDAEFAAHIYPELITGNFESAQCHFVIGAEDRIRPGIERQEGPCGFTSRLATKVADNSHRYRQTVRDQARGEGGLTLPVRRRILIACHESDAAIAPFKQVVRN